MKYLKMFKEEFIENSESLIDAKMQEIKDLVSNVSGENIIYEWENKNDHQLSVKFIYNDISINYEFDIDDLYITKIAGDVVDFEEKVDSIDEGLMLIEKDIQEILGINENLKTKRYIKMFEEFEAFDEHPEDNFDLEKPKVSKAEMIEALIVISKFSKSDLEAMSDSEVVDLYDAMKIDVENLNDNVE